MSIQRESLEDWGVRPIPFILDLQKPIREVESNDKGFAES